MTTERNSAEEMDTDEGRGLPFGCEHDNNWFDRTYCACDSLHTYCDDCGMILGWCPLNPGASTAAPKPTMVGRNRPSEPSKQFALDERLKAAFWDGEADD